MFCVSPVTRALPSVCEYGATRVQLTSRLLPPVPPSPHVEFFSTIYFSNFFLPPTHILFVRRPASLRACAPRWRWIRSTAACPSPDRWVGGDTRRFAGRYPHTGNCPGAVVAQLYTCRPSPSAGRWVGRVVLLETFGACAGPAASARPQATSQWQLEPSAYAVHHPLIVRLPQMRALERGIDVVVGTPGRIIDLLERGALKLHQVCVWAGCAVGRGPGGHTAPRGARRVG